MDDILIVAILATVSLLVLIIGFGFLIYLLRPLDAIAGIQDKLGSSTGLGAGGEASLKAILQPYMDANLVVEKLKMPDNPRSNVEFAYNIGKTQGGELYVPIDNKFGGSPKKNITDVGQKYVGKNTVNGSAFTTAFGIISVNDEHYENYTQSWKDFARKQNVIIVKHEQIIPFLEFLQWHHDIFVPLNDLSAVVNLTTRWEGHHATTADIANEIEKVVKKFKAHIVNKPENLSATLPQTLGATPPQTLGATPPQTLGTHDEEGNSVTKKESLEDSQTDEESE
jgi:hypothetical protein